MFRKLIIWARSKCYEECTFCGAKVNFNNGHIIYEFSRFACKFCANLIKRVMA